MDMSKYVKMFVSESQEHLQKMDGLLLALEQNSGDRGALDTLFREAHSLKGMSASMGYDQLAKVSHRMEDYLDRFRGGKGVLERRGVDLLFEGVDLLRRAVEEIAAGQAPTLVAESYVAKMASLMVAEPAAEAPAPSDQAEVAAARQRAEAQGLTLFTVELQIASDAPLPSARAYITLRRTRDLGELIRSAPSVDQVQAGEFSGSLSMLLATARSPAEVQAFLASLPDVASVIVRPLEDGPGADRPGPAPVGRQEAPRREGGSADLRPVPSPIVSPQPAVPAPSVAPPPAAPTGGPAGPQSRAATMIRVDTRLLDDLMDQVGELVTAKGTLLEESQAMPSQALRETVGRVETLVKGLQQHAMKLRMMPLEMIADRFPRAVRDLARKRGKELNFEILGKEIELDRAILEELPDPLLHIFRNAIDHGIEAPEERVRDGKSPTGTIRLEASKERESVLIRVSDDGRGMDPARLRRVALERGVITREQHDSLPDGEVLSLITVPGFSTAKEVTDVSGRGVGMDVVKNVIESLRGSLLIESVLGQGSTFTLKLPLTLAVVAVLLVEVGGERYALPVTYVQRMLEVPVTEIQRSQGQEMIVYDGALIPLVRLGRILGCPEEDGGPYRLLVLSEMRGRLVGLAVDRLVGYREVVVKSLGKALKGLRGFAGVTILGDGSTVLILDLNTL
ncbi:MAG: chemotaxis protein CheA [candidate division NC10 bacterium]|nr:chemotaxis protein CheA [candidate division NC10 bacterium]